MKTLTVPVLFFIILAAVTVLCHNFIAQYQHIGKQLLNSDWQVFASDSATADYLNRPIYLSSSNQKNNIRLTQKITGFKSKDKLRLSADIKHSNIIAGSQPWYGARLLLVQNDGIKNLWNHPHNVITLTGNGNWGFYSQVFDILEDTKQVHVSVQLSRSKGDFWLKNITLYKVKQTSIYNGVKKVLLFCWGSFAVLLMQHCLGRQRSLILLKMFFVLSFLMIIIGTTISPEIREQLSRGFTASFSQATEFADASIAKSISKYGHFLFFALFGSLLYRLMVQCDFLTISLAILMTAGGSELAQLYIEGRSSLVTDFLIDISGGFFGMILCSFLITLFKKRQRNIT